MSDRIQGNKVHLCDSCEYSYPVCPSRENDVVFGDGAGNDNICACAAYWPNTQQLKGTWIDADDGVEGHVRCNKCLRIYDWTSEAQYFNNCPNCGARFKR